MIRSVTASGTRERCERFLDEIKTMGYTIVTYILEPVEDGWTITVSYKDTEDLTDNN